MDGGAWWATVHGLQSQTQLSDFTFIFTTLKIHFAGSLPQLPNARAISATSGKLERKTLRTNGPNTCLGPCLLVFPDRGWLDTSSKAPALGLPRVPSSLPLPHILPRDPMDHCPTTDDSHIQNSGPGPLSQWTSEYLHWEVSLLNSMCPKLPYIIFLPRNLLFHLYFLLVISSFPRSS